ncbi:MAG: asparagine synthase-related protein [Rhizomicrobium sp.]|nr:asparagine synthase-related protein [Rhizomicrobium sp.]
MFACIARLANRDELRSVLSAPKDVDDATLLKMLFERWGADGVARAVGAFAFAHWDGACLTLGRDCTRQCTLLFHLDEKRNTIAFSSDFGILLSLPEVPREIDEFALANFLVVNGRIPRRTLYRGIERVPARHLVSYDGRTLRHKEYWTPNFTPPAHLRRFEDFVERGRELLDQAVAASLSCHDRVAISLSGGLDSSAVAATAARLFPHRRFACYTKVPPVDFSVPPAAHRYTDEGSKVQALGRMYPNLDLNIFTPQISDTPDVFEQRMLSQTQLPLLGVTLAAGMDGFYARVRADGNEATMNGNGGNAGLTWDGRYALVALLRTGSITAFVREIVALARARHRSIARIFATDVLLNTAPEPIRRALRYLKGQRPDSVAAYSALNPEFIAEHDLVGYWRETGFDPLRKPAVDNPAADCAAFVFDRELGGRHNYNVIDDRNWGETLEPLLDRRLIEFCLQVPRHYFCRDGVDRAFGRAVLADRLPPEILHERRRGGQDFDWFRRLNAQRARIGLDIARMENSPTARRLLDIPRLKRLFAEWPQDEASAERRAWEFQLVLARSVNAFRFIKYVEGGNG